jgi:hypothetical protein
MTQVQLHAPGIGAGAYGERSEGQESPAFHALIVHRKQQNRNWIAAVFIYVVG